MTGWHDFPARQAAHDWHAFSEYFVGGHPVSLGNPIMEGRMIVAAFGPSMEEAEDRRDREKPHAERLYL